MYLEKALQQTACPGAQSQTIQGKLSHFAISSLGSPYWFQTMSSSLICIFSVCSCQNYDDMENIFCISFSFSLDAPVGRTVSWARTISSFSALQLLLWSWLLWVCFLLRWWERSESREDVTKGFALRSCSFPCLFLFFTLSQQQM